MKTFYFIIILLFSSLSYAEEKVVIQLSIGDVVLEEVSYDIYISDITEGEKPSRPALVEGEITIPANTIQKIIVKIDSEYDGKTYLERAVFNLRKATGE